MADNNTYNVTITNLPESEVEIKGELSWDAFIAFEEKAFTRLAQHLELPGFRKGHLPADVAKKHLGDELILNDMAELALQEFYPRIIKEHNIDVIGRPELGISKLARGNALGFTIRSAVLPEIKLPDYKKVSSAINRADATPVTEEDIDKVIKDLQQMRAYGHVHHEGDERLHEHNEPLPEINDEFAKSFGDFASVAALRDKIKENIAREKEQEVKDKHRIAIMDSIITDTIFAIPTIVVRGEQEKMLAQIEADITRSGMTLEDYLKQSSKTKEALMEEFRPEAEKRARFQLVLNAIARKESIAPTDEEVEAEAQNMVQMYPGADINRARAYADMILTNEKTLSLLEGK